MKPSLQKLYNYFRLEVERGYDNNAVVGGLDHMLDHWTAEARADGLDETLIQVIVTRIKDYPRLSSLSRTEMLKGLWRRVERDERVPAIDFDRATDTTNSTDISKDKNTVRPTDTGDSEVQSAEEIKQKESTVREGFPEKRVDQEKIPEDVSEDRVSAKETIATEPVALDAPVTVLPGIGPTHANTLSRLGLRTLRDMLYYFPRRYDDYSLLKPINRLAYGDELTVIGTIQSVFVRNMRQGRAKIVEAVLNDGSGALRISWFNQAWIAKRLRKGAQIAVSGKVDQYLGRLVMNNPEWEYLDQGQLKNNRIVPVYPLTARLTQRRLRRMMNQVIGYWSQRVRDPLPIETQRDADLIDLPRALSQIHFPDSWDDLEAARARLAFDEIFLLQLGVLSQKQTWHERNARTYTVDDLWLNQQYAKLPYRLTQAQTKVISDIRLDLNSGHPMNRLLQGDVGSGKTVVAAYAIKIVVNAGAQAAIMAPTSILAEQHYSSLKELLVSGDSGGIGDTEISLLVGATPESEKQRIRDELAEGRIKVLVGTHALLQEPVQFSDLQLVIVDEQHRFGVNQRAILRSKGDNPHLLVMTATPIPRSLALTVYGDLDLSVMDEMPPGRKPVDTYVLTPRELERAYSLIQNEVSMGRQAFIVFPLVEESEKSQAKAAVEQHAYLQNDIYPKLKLGLLHGRLKPEEKDNVMKQFRDGRFNVLVSTTVIEVGVDIPNATVMLVEGANRFGLAQLHQLRGRVGRGAERSYCLLVPDTADEVENERLQVMAETNDGFVLAERDLEQRGPGEFLGTRQSGFTELKVANLMDVRLIEKARRCAQEIFEVDPGLNHAEHQFLSAAVQSFWESGGGDIS